LAVQQGPSNAIGNISSANDVLRSSWHEDILVSYARIGTTSRRVYGDKEEDVMGIGGGLIVVQLAFLEMDALMKFHDDEASASGFDLVRIRRCVNDTVDTFYFFTFLLIWFYGIGSFPDQPRDVSSQQS
jgi:hypothetical protein